MAENNAAAPGSAECESSIIHILYYTPYTVWIMSVFSIVKWPTAAYVGNKGLVLHERLGGRPPKQSQMVVIISLLSIVQWPAIGLIREQGRRFP